MIFSKNSYPRWVIFIVDLTFCFFVILLSFLLRFNFDIPGYEIVRMPKILLIAISIRAISFIIGKTYSGIIRYTGTFDVVRLFIVLSLGSLSYVLINLYSYYFIDQTFIIPFSIIIIDYIAIIFTLVSFRILVKIAFMEYQNPSKQKTFVIIFGAGEAGITTKRAIDRDAGSKYKVLAFLDDDKNKINKKLEGTNIIPVSKLEELVQTNSVCNLILSIQNLSSKRKNEIIEICLKHNVKVLNVPPVSHWINGELSFNQIKTINIEDLLEREVINLDKNKIKKDISNRIILVSGAAGSIGSELVRQIALYHPKKLIILDQAESPLHELELEINDKFKRLKYEIVLGDIKNISRMKKLFSSYKPDIVYHAAAYKHVPLIENNVTESIYTNVIGTKTIADLSIEYNVEKFVMISTDKAVNPTSVMGCSKRIAEIYTESLNELNKTKFITTRFGNVLGSNGSVVQLFKKQIEKGAPLTITHPEITRYFMTIPEACQLVLEAGSMGKGGEIFMFDMGESVKIINLAKKMIKLSGLVLGKDIQITYTGLRPGEKLYEELLNDHENTIPTHHPRILIAKLKKQEKLQTSGLFNSLIELNNSSDNSEIVKMMKIIVPEYKSNNSIFEELDA